MKDALIDGDLSISVKYEYHRSTTHSNLSFNCWDGNNMINKYEINHRYIQEQTYPGGPAYGLARIFKSYGCYETTITWKKGSRYPNLSDFSVVDLSQVDHEGISDPIMNSFNVFLQTLVV